MCHRTCLAGMLQTLNNDKEQADIFHVDTFIGVRIRYAQLTRHNHNVES